MPAVARALACGVCAWAALLLLVWLPRPTVHASEAAVVTTAPLRSPDDACVPCHAKIVASYRRTAMGAGSGVATDAFNDGTFTHESSGVQYRVYQQDGAAWMGYSRPSTSAKGALGGREQLLYFVGSGHRGRTYLYQQAGEWFELPINWYTRRAHWAMAPAYDDAQHMPAPLPVDANCLHCHATQLETALPEAPNRFPERPFDQGGVGCSACHGDPAAHMAAGGHGPILNPAKMSVAARDSACIQCHLEGDAVIYRPGRSLAQFQPGQVLSDFAIYFVRASQAAGGQRASSQYEALLKSACKRGAGDSLTCTTCHDPHSSPAPAERVAFYRARCVQCHNTPAIAVNHHPEQPDCASCHMPSRKTADISHEQTTDHNIERIPTRGFDEKPAWRPGEELVTVGGVRVGDREWGLAYAQHAQKGDRIDGERALGLLLRAEAAGADDAALHSNLGWLQQMAGNSAAARHEYAEALRGDPYNASALTNRAVLDARSDDFNEAVRLLDRLVRADPSQTTAGVDLLTLECRGGHAAEAKQLWTQLHAVNPDAETLQQVPAACRP